MDVVEEEGRNGDDSQQRLNHSFVSISLPGIARTPESALDRMGGKEEVLRRIREKKPLTLPIGPEKGAVHSEVSSRSRLLLRCRRGHTGEKGWINSGAAEHSHCFRVEGVIRATHSFRELLDVYFKPSDDPTKFQKPPKTFMGLPTRLEYSFKSFETLTSKNLRRITSDGANSRDMIGKKIRVVRSDPREKGLKIDIDQVPETPYLQGTLTEEEERQAHRIKTALERCPLLTSREVCKAAGTNFVSRKVLNTVSYTFRGGPWRLLWIRLGFDPRKERAARFSQIIHVRLPSRSIPSLQEEACLLDLISTTNSAGASLSTQRPRVQFDKGDELNVAWRIKDLAGRTALNLLRTPVEAEAIADHFSGFFGSEPLANLRHVLKAKVHRKEPIVIYSGDDEEPSLYPYMLHPTELQGEIGAENAERDLAPLQTAGNGERRDSAAGSDEAAILEEELQRAEALIGFGGDDVEEFDILEADDDDEEEEEEEEDVEIGEEGETGVERMESE